MLSAKRHAVFNNATGGGMKGGVGRGWEGAKFQRAPKAGAEYVTLSGSLLFVERFAASIAASPS